MALYYYSRYNVNTSSAYYSEDSWVLQFSNVTADNVSGYTGYSFDSESGEYSLTGESQYYSNEDDFEGDLYDLSGSTKLIKYAVVSHPYTLKYDYYDKGRTYHPPVNTRGSFIETITAEDGTYPADGISGGYWYVKGSAVPAAPTVALAISPTSGDTETTYTLTAAGNPGGYTASNPKYRYQYKVNGGSYITLDENNTTETFVPAAYGIKSRDIVKFRVQYLTTYGTSTSDEKTLIPQAPQGAAFFLASEF